MNLKDRIAYRGLWLMVSGLKLLPWRMRYYVGYGMGSLAYYFARREKRIAILQLKKILHTDKPHKLARQTFNKLCASLFASLNVGQIIDDPSVSITISDPKLFDKILQSERPTVALTAHYGNWDLLAAKCSRLGANFLTIGRTVRNPALQSVLAKQREEQGIATLWRNDRRSNRLLLQRFTENYVIAALVDQDTKVKARSASFFGQTVATPTSLLELGLRNNANIISVFLRQISISRYEIVISEIAASQAEQIFDEYHQTLEQLVREDPASWVWFHKRWRSQLRSAGTGQSPALYRLSHKEYLEFLNAL